MNVAVLVWLAGKGLRPLLQDLPSLRLMALKELKGSFGGFQVILWAGSVDFSICYVKAVVGQTSKGAKNLYLGQILSFFSCICVFFPFS